MNRVPEALKLLENKINYVQNWSVINSAWKVYHAENHDQIEAFKNALPRLVSVANAASLQETNNSTALGVLLDPRVCFSCSFPAELAALPLPKHTKYKFGLGRQTYFSGFGSLDRRQWNQVSDWYVQDPVNVTLDSKFERQIAGSGKADWSGFNFSQTYWNHLTEISQWAKQNDKGLYFVIPPTVTKLQSTIKNNGLEHLNHQFRVELSKLGNVVDFDFPNQITNDASNFSDAYHFNSVVARKLAGEVASLVSSKIKSHKRYVQHSGDFSCPSSSTDAAKATRLTKGVETFHGLNCRIWKGAGR